MNCKYIGNKIQFSEKNICTNLKIPDIIQIKNEYCHLKNICKYFEEPEIEGTLSELVDYFQVEAMKRQDVEDFEDLTKVVRIEIEILRKIASMLEKMD